MFRCEEMLARARDGVRRRRFAVESVSNFARIVTEGSRWLFPESVWAQGSSNSGGL